MWKKVCVILIVTRIYNLFHDNNMHLPNIYMYNLITYTKMFTSLDNQFPYGLSCDL